MHTLFDVESDPRRQGEGRTAPGWPENYPPKARLIVPQAGKLTLPKDVRGLDAWVGDAGRSANETCEPSVGGDEDENVEASGMAIIGPARVALLTRPTFVAQLPRPDIDWMRARRIDSSSWRRESSPRHLLLATRFDHGGWSQYGTARTLLVENALGFGSTSIVHHEEVWLDDFDPFADHLALQVVDAIDLQPAPEGNASPWTTAMLLLNDQAREPALPTGWEHALKMVAGLYRVRLRIHASAWANRKKIEHDIRTTPPAALLVADGSISAPEVFLAPYRSARPEGYAETLGSSGSSFAEQILELGEHLKILAPRRPSKAPPPSTWSEAKTVVENLECDSFKLTDRAREMLVSNPYPDPARMAWHLERLAALAAEYADVAGEFGQRLAVEARRFGIEIAMHDSSLSPNDIASGNASYRAEPHVKVDDAKTADKCGRIYFAVDSVLCVFLVDHIGLHDY